MSDPAASRIQTARVPSVPICDVSETIAHDAHRVVYVLRVVEEHMVRVVPFDYAGTLDRLPKLIDLLAQKKRHRRAVDRAGESS